MAGLALREAVLGAQDVVKSYGAQPVLSHLSLTVHEGERIGLIGRNGSGKSTLLKVLAGLELPDEGLVTRRQGLRVALLQQDCPLERAQTIGETLEDACRETRDLFLEHDALAERLAAWDPESAEHLRLQERYEALHHELDLTGAWGLPQTIQRIALALNLPGNDRVLNTLSGGELRRVDLAATLLAHPDVLLLDEPTNHIDTKSAEWIERFLAGYAGSCILVTHDRYFLEQIVTRIVEMEFSRLYSFPGNYTRFLEYKAQLKDVEVRTEESRQGILRRELEWIRRGPKARATKAKARIRRYNEIVAEGPPEVHRDIAFQIPNPGRLGKRIMDAEVLAFGFGERRLFQDFSLILQKGMRIGIIGPSGCGKTSLLRVLMGEQPPSQGRVLIGETTQFLYVDQTHEEINPEHTILEFVSGGANYWVLDGRRIFVPSYLERFLFDRDSIHMPMRNLSGGERNRIHLAKRLLRGGNVIVLDEPTNDLDLPTLRVLEEAILAFDGCALIVSHDRYFLNRLCTHLIVFEEGKQRLLLIAGNYDDYLLYKEKIEAAQSANAAIVQTPKKPAQSGAPASDTEPRPQRLTYKEQRELKAIEPAIETAEAEVIRLEALLCESGFYEKPYALVRKTLEALEAAKTEVERLYARWHDLEQRQS